jgi:LPXTG-motif cell wall-anchored protein
MVAPPPVLPQTASQLPLVGLAGLGSFGLGGVMRTLRRRLL